VGDLLLVVQLLVPASPNFPIERILPVKRTNGRFDTTSIGRMQMRVSLLMTRRSRRR
jgi:hypothetical protein